MALIKEMELSTQSTLLDMLNGFNDPANLDEIDYVIDEFIESENIDIGAARNALILLTKFKRFLKLINTEFN